MKAPRKAKIGRVYTYNGLNRVETDEAEMGDIIALQVSTILTSAKQ